MASNEYEAAMCLAAEITSALDKLTAQVKRIADVLETITQQENSQFYAHIRTGDVRHD